jgi:hypothetical protein
MKNLIIILSLITGLSSCGFFGSSEESEKIGVAITSGVVGDYKIGDNFNDIVLANNQTINSIDVHVGEGEYEARHFLKDNNMEMLKFSTDGSGIITEIEVLSPLYKTKEEIGTGSSLQKLGEAYGEIKLWYTYVAGQFIAETSQLKNIQFFIDAEAFLGDRNTLHESDMIELTSDDFLPDAKIETIRVF